MSSASSLLATPLTSHRMGSRAQVAESRPYNEKADVYSYGMVLWEMASMRKPFANMGRDQFFAEVVRGSARPPINRKWPKEFTELMQVQQILVGFLP